MTNFVNLVAYVHFMKRNPPSAGMLCCHQSV